MENQAEMDALIRDRYKNLIGYYWKSSRANKKWYKLTRSLTVIFGALVTLIASLTSSEIITGSAWLKDIFTIGTPVLAALLTVIAGFTQSFQWGSTWQNMVLTAEEMQREFDKYLVTPADQRKYLEEAEKLNNYVINESRSFFDRMLGTAVHAKDTDNDNNGK